MLQEWADSCNVNKGGISDLRLRYTKGMISVRWIKQDLRPKVTEKGSHFKRDYKRR